jgi:glycosyltransferase involved in cell wall biosynthesis
MISSAKSVILVRSRAIDPSIHKVARTLARHGYTVKVLIWDREGKKSVEKKQGYVTIYFGIKAPYDKLAAGFRLPLWWFYEFLFLLLNKAEIIHASDLDTLLPAIVVRMVRKATLFYTIYDFYADNLPGSFPSPIRRFVAFLEKLGIELTDALFLVDPNRYEQVVGTRIKKLAFLYNSPPDHSKEDFEIGSKAASELTLFYAGNINKTRGLRDVMEAIRNLDGVKLIVAGTGPDVSMFQMLPRNFEDKVEYIGFIPYEKVIEGAFRADALFAFYDPAIRGNRYASPNKLFEAMMCGKPIIVNAETTAAKIVGKERCGIIVPYGDICAIRNAIIRLRDDHKLRVMLGKNGRMAYQRHYDWKHMERRLLELYDEAIFDRGERIAD